MPTHTLHDHCQNPVLTPHLQQKRVGVVTESSEGEAVSVSEALTIWWRWAPYAWSTGCWERRFGGVIIVALHAQRSLHAARARVGEGIHLAHDQLHVVPLPDVGQVQVLQHAPPDEPAVVQAVLNAAVVVGIWALRLRRGILAKQRRELRLVLFNGLEHIPKPRAVRGNVRYLE